jgi:hypothetical protein
MGIIGSAFLGFTRVYGAGGNGDSPAPPSNFNPSLLLDAYTAGYTLVGGTAGTSNIIDTLSGTGLTLYNIYNTEPAYMETTYCAALRSDTTLTQIETSYLRIESNGGDYFAPNYPCTNLTGYQNMVYGWDTPAYNSLNVDVSNGFTAIVVARKLNIGTDEGDQALLSLGFDYNAPMPSTARFLQIGKEENGGEDNIRNRWYWNNDATGNGGIRATTELQEFNTSKFTFSAIASGVPNLQSGNFDDIVMTDGTTYATGDGLAGSGENVTASTLTNMVINRDYWESTYGISVFTGRDWDIAAIMLFPNKLTNLQIQRIYNYYKDERGYDMY